MISIQFKMIKIMKYMIILINKLNVYPNLWYQFTLKVDLKIFYKFVKIILNHWYKRNLILKKVLFVMKKYQIYKIWCQELINYQCFKLILMNYLKKYKKSQIRRKCSIKHILLFNIHYDIIPNFILD